LRTGTTSYGNSGFFTLDTGEATGGKAGYVRIIVGEGDSGKGGDVEVVSGMTTAQNREGGKVTVKSGYSLDMDSGPITVSSPNAGLEGVSGFINLYTGTTSEGSSGYIMLDTGAAVSGHGGNIELFVGVGDSGDGGHITLVAGETTAAQVAGARLQLRLEKAATQKKTMEVMGEMLKFEGAKRKAWTPQMTLVVTLNCMEELRLLAPGATLLLRVVVATYLLVEI